MRVASPRQIRKGRGRDEVTYFPIGDLPETLKNLLGRVLIFGHTDHEPNELLESHMPTPACNVPERLFHLHLVIHQAQTRERGAELQLVQRIGKILVEMPEDGLKLFELDGSQVRHVAGDHLIFEEGELFRDGAFDEAELVGELIVGVGCEIVFFDVCFSALLVEEGEGGEEGVEGGEVIVKALHVCALIVDVAFQTGYGEGEGVEGECKVVGAIGEATAEVVLDARFDVNQHTMRVMANMKIRNGLQDLRWQNLLSYSLVDYLTPFSFRVEKNSPFIVKHLKLQVVWRLVRPEAVSTHLRLNVT